MRFRTASLLAGVLIITSIESRLAVSAQDTPGRSVLMLRVVRDIGEEHGTAVVIHRDDRGSDTVLHFLTSSCLFRTPQGDQRPPARIIELLLDDGQLATIADMERARMARIIARLRHTAAHQAPEVPAA
jgi:hypothetical protein